MGEVCSKATLAQICNETETERYQIEHPTSPRIQDMDFSSIREGVFDKRKKELPKSRLYHSKYDYGEVTKDRDDGPILRYNDELILDYNERIAQVDEENLGSENNYRYNDPYNISSYQMTDREKSRLDNLYMKDDNNDNEETTKNILGPQGLFNSILLKSEINQEENEEENLNLELKKSQAEIQGEAVNQNGLFFADLFVQKAEVEAKRNTDISNLKNMKMFKPSPNVLEILEELPPFTEHYYKTDEQDKSRFTQPDVHIDKDLSYFGSLNGQKFQGNGILVKLDDFFYQGHFMNNVFSGYGRLILPNGTYYTGFFMGGNFHGKGELVNKQDDYVYRGSFSRGKIEGFGIKIYSDGSHFEGQFIDYKENGPGLKVLKDGTLITATFEEGRVSKNGTIEFPNGNIYQGGLKDRPVLGEGNTELFQIFRQGTGRLEKEDTDEVYEGGFVNDKEEGKGKLTM